MGFFAWLRRLTKGKGKLWVKASPEKLDEYEPSDDLVAKFPSIPRDHLCLLIAAADTQKGARGEEGVVVALFALCAAYQRGTVTAERRGNLYYLYGTHV